MNSVIAQYVDSVRDALNSRGDLDAVLSAILDGAIGLTGATEGGVLVAARNMSCLRIQVWRGSGVELKSRIIPMDEESSICAWALSNKQPLSVSDVREEKRYYPQSNSNIRSELAVPVISRGIPLGVVNLESEVVGHFSEGHAEPLTAFCNAVSLYWDLASLLNWQQREKEQSRVLTATTASLLSGSKATLKAILDGALALTHADIGGILTLNASGDSLIINAPKNLRPEEDRRLLPRGTGTVWRAIDTGQMQNIADVQNNPDYINLSEGDIKSLLAAPLIINGYPIGVINVESVELNHFSFEDADILKLFADQAAIAISNAKMLEQMEAAQAIAGLGSISGNLAHRMNNIVGGVRVLAGLLAADLEKNGSEFVATARQIEVTAKDALDVVDQYERLFSHPEEPVDLQQLIEQIIAKVKHPQGVCIRVTGTQSPVSITTSRYQMSELIAELIRNAIKSIGDSGSIELTVRETQNIIEIVVDDDGKGIPEERLSQIFNQGFSDRDDSIGKGFGLWWVRTYLQMLGGKVTAGNKPMGGATISVIIPKKRPLSTRDLKAE